ncbi:hypothetical protein V1478_007125 [Vespula squamosa]|uniref:Uncharacterized protein n=1 Tax=Vespula squamosa TaxID=30214 RepID=A0ABD2B287_VESSQ
MYIYILLQRICKNGVFRQNIYQREDLTSKPLKVMFFELTLGCSALRSASRDNNYYCSTNEIKKRALGTLRNSNDEKYLLFLRYRMAGVQKTSLRSGTEVEVSRTNPVASGFLWRRSENSQDPSLLGDVGKSRSVNDPDIDMYGPIRITTKVCEKYERYRLLKDIHFLLLESLLTIQKSENFTIYSNKEVEERKVVEEVLKFLKTKLKIARKSDVESSLQSSDLHVATNFILSGNLLGRDERWIAATF